MDITSSYSRSMPFMLLSMEILRFKVLQSRSWFIGWMQFFEAGRDEKTTGATYINASALICSIIFKNHPQIAFMVISTFVWGDAVAALVGQSVAARNREQVSEGSLACLALWPYFLLCGVPACAASSDKCQEHYAGDNDNASLCVTVLELVP